MHADTDPEERGVGDASISPPSRSPEQAPRGKAAQSLTRRTPASLTGVLLLGALGAAISLGAVSSAGAVWQLGRMVARVLELTQQPTAGPPAALPAAASAAAGSAAPPRAAPSVASRTVVELDSPAVSSVSHGVGNPPSGAEPPTLSSAGLSSAGLSSAIFETNAEASERTVPVGLMATANPAALDDVTEPLVLGEPPPPSYPRRTDCDDVFVYIVTIVEGAPERSAASLGVGRKSPARVRIPGERIGDFTVLAISDDWSGLQPQVWLEKDGAVCDARLAGNPTRVHVSPKPPPLPPVRTKPRSKLRERRARR